MGDLEGRTALVTGGGKGIGRAIAQALSRMGARVVVNYRADARAAEETARSLADGSAVQADVGDGEQVERMFKATGRVDVLVNNAGALRDKLLLRMTQADWDDIIRTDLTAAFLTTKAALAGGMLRNRWGRIVNLSSIAGIIGNPGQANYAAAKAGLIGMSKSLAQELASRSITVNCIAPGIIATPMTEALTDDQKKAILARVPADRLGTSDEIAAGVVYLASDEAAYITGQTLHINGGMAMI